MATRGEALEADFQRFYGIDLAGLWRGTITVRNVGVLALHLPPEAAVNRTGPDDSVWSTETQILVTLADMFMTFVTKGKSKRLTRPGDKKREKSMIDRIVQKAERWQQTQTNK